MGGWQRAFFLLNAKLGSTRGTCTASPLATHAQPALCIRAGRFSGSLASVLVLAPRPAALLQPAQAEQIHPAKSLLCQFGLFDCKVLLLLTHGGTFWWFGGGMACALQETALPRLCLPLQCVWMAACLCCLQWHAAVLSCWHSRQCQQQHLCSVALLQLVSLCVLLWLRPAAVAAAVAVCSLLQQHHWKRPNRCVYCGRQRSLLVLAACWQLHAAIKTKLDPHSVLGVLFHLGVCAVPVLSRPAVAVCKRHLNLP